MADSEENNNATEQPTQDVPQNDSNTDNNQTDVPSGAAGIIALGIYLFLMIAAAIAFLAILFWADTGGKYNSAGDLVSECNSGRFYHNANNGNANNQCANCNSSNAGNSNSNTSANVNANANSNSATNVNANTNAATTPTARPSASPSPTATRASETNTVANTNSANTNSANANAANPNEARPFQQNIPEITIPPHICSSIGLLNADVFVFIVVFFAGMLGAVIRAVYSYTNHLGLGNFSFKWTWYYILLPFFGGALSVAIYFVLRGGFYGASFGKGLILNIYSFAAFAALTGLFTANALEKLRQVADTLLTKVPPKVNNSAEEFKKNKGQTE